MLRGWLDLTATNHCPLLALSSDVNEVRRLLTQQPQAYDPRDPHLDDNAGVLVVERDPDTKSIVSVKRFDDVDDVRVSTSLLLLSLLLFVHLKCKRPDLRARLARATTETVPAYCNYRLGRLRGTNSLFLGLFLLEL